GLDRSLRPTQAQYAGLQRQFDRALNYYGSSGLAALPWGPASTRTPTTGKKPFVTSLASPARSLLRWMTCATPCNRTWPWLVFLLRCAIWRWKSSGYRTT